MKTFSYFFRLQHQQLAAAQLAHSRHSQNGGSSKLSGSSRRDSETSHSPVPSDDDSDSYISLGGPPSPSLSSPPPSSNGLSVGPPTPPPSISSILSPFTSVPPSLPLLHRPFSSPRLSWYSTIHPLVPGWWIVIEQNLGNFSIFYFSFLSSFCGTTVFFVAGWTLNAV